MRKRISLTLGILVLGAVFSVFSGCRTMSSTGATSRWWSPKSRVHPNTAETEAPAFLGQASGAVDASTTSSAIPDLFSNSPVASPSTPIAPPEEPPVPFPFQDVVAAPSPTVGTTLPVAPPSPASVAAPVVAAPAVPVDDPWSTVMSQANSPTYGAPTRLASPENSKPPISPLPQPPPSAGLPDYGDDPWGFGSESQARNTVSIEAAAKKEEEEAAERARLTAIATAKRKDGIPEHLQPLEQWNGPFATRQKKQTIEQDIIRQVGHVEVAPQAFDNTPVFDWEKEEQKGFDWSILDPVNFFTKVRDWVGMGPDEKKATAAMKKGRELLDQNRDLKNRKKTQEAAKHFKEAAWRWPDSVMEEDALHLAAECYFFGDDYPQALKTYQKLLIKYQHSKHIDNAVRRLFAIARYWEKEDRRGVSSVNFRDKSRPTFDTFGYCHKAYETIFTYDPNGPISDDAVMALASAYLAKGRYQGDGCFDRAAYYYKHLRENFPMSKHVAKAYEYEVYARTQAYMGAEHNGETLDEAGKLAEMTLKQFSSELDREDREEVLQLKEGVIERQAEREWTLGQYYEKKGYFGSARLYYEKLLDRYPQTGFAEQARSRLEDIRDKPERPDQFEFFKRLYRPRESF